MKRTEDYISLEREELCEAIYANDSAFIAEVMEGFNFVKDGTPPPTSQKVCIASPSSRWRLQQ
ncbi:hypothetical protein IJG11_01550 [Candidatus Saccharibacteria bacterium]|nr:hypothetical protein [Candidatus Saccharibacteria bacterium]